LGVSHPESTVTPLLEVEGLRKSFALKGPRTWAARLRGERPAVRAVDGVSFAIANGETLGLVGESGCGKSTVARCLLRVIEPTTGTIRFASEEITALDGRQLRRTRRAMQMVYQDPTAALNPRLNVRSTIEEPLRLHFKTTPAERRERLSAVIAEVGLGADLVERYPHELSIGQRQRVNIARAIAAHPSLVVLDEPTSALDVSLRSRIILLLEALQKRLGLSFLFISHDIATVKYLAHRIAVMYLGVIVEEADGASLLADPRHPYTRALLSSVPVPDPDFRSERLVMNGEIPSSTKAYDGCRLCSRCPLAKAACAERVPRREVAPGHHVLCHFA
jgi:oligopeptide/dipeptide ABC transporter ATP-binding protein